MWPNSSSNLFNWSEKSNSSTLVYHYQFSRRSKGVQLSSQWAHNSRSVHIVTGCWPVAVLDSVCKVYYDKLHWPVVCYLYPYQYLKCFKAHIYFSSFKITCNLQLNADISTFSRMATVLYISFENGYIMLYYIIQYVICQVWTLTCKLHNHVVVFPPNCNCTVTQLVSLVLVSTSIAQSQSPVQWCYQSLPRDKQHDYNQKLGKFFSDILWHLIKQKSIISP